MKHKKETLLEIHNLSISFRMYAQGLEQKELKVISDLDLTVYPGEIIAIAGSSGSGKSLLASAILGSFRIMRPYRVIYITRERRLRLSDRSNFWEQRLLWFPSLLPILIL